ncbi:MAG: hypothetical protein RSA84_22870, partial [Acinetobacter sp.]
HAEMLVMPLGGENNNYELPLLAHSGPSAQLVRPLRARSGLNVMLSIKSLFDALHIWITLGSGFMENVTQPAISPSAISSRIAMS